MQGRIPAPVWLLALLTGVLGALALHRFQSQAPPANEDRPVSASSAPCEGDTLRARMCAAATEGGFASIVGY